MVTEIRYINCPDTAKLIRATLKEHFPSTKFSIRSHSYSGGASINIHWVDGPTPKHVEKVTGKFEGASFDGMIDLKSYHDGLLNGELVHFGADYIFYERKYSVQFLTKVALATAKKYGFSVPVIKESSSGAWIEHDYKDIDGSHYDAADLIWQAAEQKAA